MNARFREEDRVLVHIEGIGTVSGTVKRVDTLEESDAEEIVFLVRYDSPVDGQEEGIHVVDDLRLIHGPDDQAPLPPPDLRVNTPTYNHYMTKIAGRINSLFDALFVKHDVSEDWNTSITVRGIHNLNLILDTMSLMDISQIYGELMRYTFGLMVTGDQRGTIDMYRNLAGQILQSALVEGHFADADGYGRDRFRRIMAEGHPIVRKPKREED